MKTSLYIVILLLGTCVTLPAQHILQGDLNLPRAGEEIIKQQVAYKDPGRPGENVLWDFGQLQPVNNEYTLSYFAPEMTDDSLYILGMDTIPSDSLTGGTLLTGCEHNTMYYYRLTGSRLYLLGHENPTVLLKYSAPLIAGRYPMHYLDSCRHSYQAKGLYSSAVPFTTGGEVELTADAFGMMILPSGDTLRHVMRTKTIQTIRQTFVMNDTLTVEQNSLVETFKWYSKGYRYPVFETIQTRVMGDTGSVNFETAFFFPPQEHFYLDEDTLNLAIREELKMLETGTQTDPWAGLTYNFYPNPVKNTPLEVELYLPRRVGNIRIQLRNTSGMIAVDENKGSYPEGICRLQLPVYFLQVDNYVLNIWLNGKLIEGIILKR